MRGTCKQEKGQGQMRRVGECGGEMRHHRNAQAEKCENQGDAEKWDLVARRAEAQPSTMELFCTAAYHEAATGAAATEGLSARAAASAAAAPSATSWAGVAGAVGAGSWVALRLPHFFQGLAQAGRPMPNRSKEEK